ncbi:leucyl aminopeptidase family protein [Alphaproteobacteria bacterium LMG 31809]|uniref:Leucyl aminopeptidase family protein n=1 Tax=Govanella unica TaxID=2975056 RepID=A0A9X3Z6F6_9PROT|nr:leucyl aminopeptidase family protein [Govania unica]
MPTPLPVFVTPVPQSTSVAILLLTESATPDWLAAASPFVRGWAETRGFSGKKDDILILPDESGKIDCVLLGTGGGLSAEGDPAAFARLAAELPAGTYDIASPLEDGQGYLAALGWCLQQYAFTRYKDGKASEPRVLVLPAGVDAADLARVVAGTALVRDLVNTPTADMGPTELAAAARVLAESEGASFREIVGDGLLQDNFPTIHAVGRASPNAPRLIDITWGDEKAPKVTVVGKGVCFDTGGLDLKPSSGMRLMKKDMGGAAHALALGQMIMDARLPVRLRILIPAVENSVSGESYRPGDVIRTRKGLTVEVDNTDAEGRLVLSDALALADDETPDLLIDFATLTGAARVALGPDVQPFFTDSADLATALETASRSEADPVWRLPLWQPYFEDLKSPIADFANSGASGLAGAITAALFLQRFVTETPNWIHLDVFAWNRGNRPGRPQGGEALALRAVYRMIVRRYTKET